MQDVGTVSAPGFMKHLSFTFWCSPQRLMSNESREEIHAWSNLSLDVVLSPQFVTSRPETRMNAFVRILEKYSRCVSLEKCFGRFDHLNFTPLPHSASWAEDSLKCEWVTDALTTRWTSPICHKPVMQIYIISRRRKATLRICDGYGEHRSHYLFDKRAGGAATKGLLKMRLWLSGPFAWGRSSARGLPLLWHLSPLRRDCSRLTAVHHRPTCKESLPPGSTCFVGYRYVGDSGKLSIIICLWLCSGFSRSTESGRLLLMHSFSLMTFSFVLKMCPNCIIYGLFVMEFSVCFLIFQSQNKSEVICYKT